MAEFNAILDGHWKKIANISQFQIETELYFQNPSHSIHDPLIGIK